MSDTGPVDFSVADIWQRWRELRERGQSVTDPITIKGLSSQWRFDWG